MTGSTAFRPQVQSAARLEYPVSVRDRRVRHGDGEQGARGGADAAGDLRQVPCRACHHLQVVPD